MLHTSSEDNMSCCADTERLRNPSQASHAKQAPDETINVVQLDSLGRDNWLNSSVADMDSTPMANCHGAGLADLDWESYPPSEFQLPWRACADLLRSHGLSLWGIPEYEDPSHDKDFPKKPAPDPFHPKDDQDFVHRLATDWVQPHLNISEGYFQESAILHLALDRHFRHVIIKVMPEDSEELQILKQLSSEPLRADPRNHTIPVLQSICGARVQFAVQACWGEHWKWPPFDCAQSRFELARQLLEGLHFMHDNGISHGDIHPRNIVWNRSDRRPREVWQPPLEKPLFHSQFDFRMAYIDFGAAMKFSAGRRSLIGSGIRPPEQLLDAPYDVCAADVFMLGRVLLEELAEGREWYNICLSDERYRKYDDLLVDMTSMDPDTRPSASEAMSRLQTLTSDEQRRNRQ